MRFLRKIENELTDLRQTQDKIATTLDEVRRATEILVTEQRALAHIQERTLAALERIAKCQETMLRLESLKVTHSQSSLTEWRSKIVETVNNALVTNGTDRAEEK